MPDTISSQSSEAARFGPFVFWPAARRLEKHGEPVRLGARAMDILIMLVGRAGKIVSYQDLQDGVWKNINVDPNSLRVQMMALRKVLGEGEAGGQYIATIPGRGYCFVVPVLRPLSEQEFLIRQREIALPKLIPLVGREQTVRSVVAKLVETRLVTITGTGGVGKTSVAVAVAHALVPAFDGAVYFLDLSAATTPQAALGLFGHTALPTAIHLGQQSHQIVQALRGRRMLLVLDCVDNLSASMAELATSILSEAPEVHILVTSREILGAKLETVITLTPLAYPDSESCFDVDRVGDYASIQLLSNLLTREAGAFQPGPDNVQAMARIAAQLEGLPLALELAAGSIVMSGMAHTESIVGSRFALFLTNPYSSVARHQSLNATLEWSYGQLTPELREIFRNMSVFNGPFTLDGIHKVATGADTSRRVVAAAASTLVAKSIIYKEEGAEQLRYRMLDSTRAFALSKLVDSGEELAIKRRLAEHMTERMIHANAADGGIRILRRANGPTFNIHNIIAALQWCFSPLGDTVLGARLAAESGPLFTLLSMHQEGLRWLTAALSKLDSKWAGTKVELDIRVGIVDCLTNFPNEVHLMAVQLPAINELADKLDNGIVRAESRAWDCLLMAQIRPISETIELATCVRNIAISTNDYPTRLLGDWLLGFAYHLRGDLQSVAPLCTSAETLVLTSDSIFISSCLAAVHIGAVGSLIRTLWLQGKPEMALATARVVLDRPGGGLRNREAAPIFFIPFFTWVGAWEDAEDGITLILGDAGSELVRGWGLGFKGSLLLRRDHIEAAIPVLQESLRTYPLNCDPGVVATDLAEALALSGQFDAATQAIDTAFASAERSGESFFFPELYRVMGVVMANAPPDQSTDAETWFLRAIECASRQGSLSFELRAATSLARLYLGAGLAEKARGVLAAVYARFTEGFDTPDLVAARQLLEQIDATLHVLAVTNAWS